MSSQPKLMKDSNEKLDQTSELEDASRDPQDPEIFANSLEEKRLVRKLDKRILPITCLLYLFASLDRSNLGNARLQGLPEDALGGDKTGIAFQIPATICSKLFPPKVYVACAAIGWGMTSTLMAAGFNFASLMTARVVLGIFEAGFAPFALWFGFATVAGAFGGLIAFGVQHIHSSVANWKLLFIIEGIPTVILGCATYFYLPNRPESTVYLTERERKIAVSRMNRDSSGDNGAVVNKAHIISAFRDWRLYVGGVIYFGLNCALASIGAFLPTIIATLGFTNALAQLLTVPPYVVAAIVMVSFSFTSDRLQSRGIFMTFSSAIGGIGYCILLIIVPNNVHARYFATFCITSGTYTTIGLTIAWFGHNLGSETKKAAGIPLFMAIGQCGSILGSHLYPKTEGPRYIALMFIAALCSLILSISYRLDNNKRDRIYGKPQAGTKINTHELADKAPEFRYVP
ncbi:major facilitator superfamily domain-containing protein [Pholiota molesta]|nr:major facilitator superfamily domain-containing protein [Pholiota molesta]